MSIAGNRRPHIGRKWLGIAMWLWAMTVCGAASAADEGLTLAIEQAVRMVVPNGTVVLAAAAAPGPHWTFVNTKGERFTAATPDEMKRMPGVLAPGMKDTDQRLLLVLAEETVFSQLEAAAALPKSAILRLSTATGVYPLHEGPPPVAQLSSKLRVEIGERAAFDEVLAQLDRSLARRGIRIISLEPGAAAIISPRPTIDKMGKPDLIERIDPYRLKDALSALRGQTVDRKSVV